jgi:hypothetical protein
MKVPLKTVMMVCLLFVATASFSWASTIQNYLPIDKPIVMKFINYDVGVHYTIADTVAPFTGEGTLNGLPQTAPNGAAALEDSWGVYNLTGIYLDNGLYDTVFWLPNAAAYGNTTVSGIYWGGADSYLEQKTVVVGGKKIVSQHIGASGFSIALWEHPASDPVLDVSGGPLLRANGGAGFPQYPTVTSGTAPIWTFETVPGYVPDALWDTSQTRDFLANYTVNYGNNQVSGGGGMWADLSSSPYGEGTLNHRILPAVPDSDGFTGDIKINFTNTGVPSHGWDVNSNDPAYTTTTPELSSGGLMLISMLPIGLAWWRRRKA